jgi:hypothetical protein
MPSETRIRKRVPAWIKKPPFGTLLDSRFTPGRNLRLCWPINERVGPNLHEIVEGRGNLDWLSDFSGVEINRVWQSQFINSSGTTLINDSGASVQSNLTASTFRSTTAATQPQFDLSRGFSFACFGVFFESALGAVMLQKGDTVNSNAQFQVRWNVGADNNIHFRISTNGTAYAIDLTYNLGGAGTGPFWRPVIVTYDNVTARIYSNGGLANSVALAGPMFGAASTNVRWENLFTNNSWMYFAGFWDRKLEDWEVLNMNFPWTLFKMIYKEALETLPGTDPDTTDGIIPGTTSGPFDGPDPNRFPGPNPPPYVDGSGNKNIFIYYGHQYEFLKDPLDVTRHDSYELDFGWTRWKFIRRLWFAGISSASITLTIYVDEVLKYTIPFSLVPATGTGWAKVVLKVPAGLKGMLFRFTLTSSAAFKIFLDQSDIEWHPLSGDRGYERAQMLISHLHER